MTWRETPVRGWAALAVSSAAVLYGVGFLVWAVAVPGYAGGETFLEVAGAEGFGSELGLLLASQSVVVSAVVWLLLHRLCHTGSAICSWLAGLTVALFVAWAFIGGFSLSFGTFPAAMLLWLAWGLTPVPRNRTV